MLTYQDLQSTDFFTFFNCSEIASKEEQGLTVKELKTGGFQEAIDLSFKLDASSTIVEALLLLDRSWVGDEKNINPFAKDIAKSFVQVLAVEEEQKDIAPLVHYLFEQVGSEDKVITIQPQKNHFIPPSLEIRKILEVFIGKHPEMPFLLLSSKYLFKNIVQEGKQRLAISWSKK
jgi:hypothetical protein